MAGHSSEVVVIGGGIIGCSIAYNLAKAGVEVTVVERRGIAAEASGANMGMVLSISHEPGTVMLELVRETSRLLPELEQELGVDFELQQVGTIQTFVTPEALAEGQERAGRLKAAGLDIRMISGEEARALEPFVSPDVIGAAFCASDALVNPMSLTTGLARAAVRLGARILCPATVTGIEIQRGRVAAVETDRERILTRTVVNAAGPWSAQIGQLVGLDIPVVPARGQVLLTERLPRLITRIVTGQRPGLRQTRAGNVIIGSTREFVGYDKQNLAATLAELSKRFSTNHPWLRDVRIIRTWAGLRPATPDHQPFLGPVKEIEGFIVAAGHFHHGVGGGPATGKVIAELITAKPTSISLAGSGLDRALVAV
ncbi:MAG: FAD-binding oxidoreductase [Chloroflexi bacterium]|nr:FAD-binding oxidoreductase [Chloroflexota bacterium]